MCVLSKRYKYNKVDSCQYEYYKMKLIFYTFKILYL
jgi:hypothetical protein